jgi:hypothetical protein
MQLAPHAHPLTQQSPSEVMPPGHIAVPVRRLPPPHEVSASAMMSMRCFIHPSHHGPGRLNITPQGEPVAVRSLTYLWQVP